MVIYVLAQLLIVIGSVVRRGGTGTPGPACHRTRIGPDRRARTAQPARDMVRAHRLAREPAIVASHLLTKCLNLLFPIGRGAYQELPALVLSVIAFAIILPLSVILGVRKSLR